MTWNDPNFTSGMTLTASIMTALQGNFAAIAQQDSGAPQITFANSTLVASAGLVTDVGCAGQWHAASGFVAPEVSSFGAVHAASGFVAPEVSSFGAVHAASGFVGPGVSSLGTLVLGDGPSGTPAANALYRENVPKAWVNFDGAALTAGNDLTGVRDHFNISGITDDGMGAYTVYFDRNFANADYAVLVAGPTLSITARNIVNGYDTPTVGSVGCHTEDSNGAALDSSQFSLMALGDQS